METIQDLVNQKERKSTVPNTIKFDCQWANPQKRGHKATKATTTVMAEYKDKSPIIAMVHENNKYLKHNFKRLGEFFIHYDDGGPIKCLEKLSTIEALKQVSIRLNKIEFVCGDGCNANISRMKKIVLVYHPEASINVDAFHSTTSVPSEWKSLQTKKCESKFEIVIVKEIIKDIEKICEVCQTNYRFNNRKKNCTNSKCKKPTVWVNEVEKRRKISVSNELQILYPNFSKIESRLIITHFIYCGKHNFGVNDQIEKWLNFEQYLNKEKNICLEDHESVALKEFLNGYIDKVKLCPDGKSTSHVEGFHSIKNKFCPKGSNQSPLMYNMKTYIASLYWNAMQLPFLNTYIEDLKKEFLQIGEKKIKNKSVYIRGTVTIQKNLFRATGCDSFVDVFVSFEK
jgi:hypothetical protein